MMISPMFALMGIDEPSRTIPMLIPIILPLSFVVPPLADETPLTIRRLS
jgi:hypothetical protein